MKVFISWSGQLSKEIGEILRKWLPGVLQSVKPYFTPDDVEKGARWNTEISKELEESQIGVMILTRENLQSSWIMFESGALSKQMGKSRVCPILFGIENTDLQGPLVQFQATAFNQDEMHKLVKTINSACGEQRLDDAVVNEVFQLWWPKLEKEVSSKVAKYKEDPKGRLRSDRELIEEILSLVRVSASRRTIPVEAIGAGPIHHLMQIRERLIDACVNHDHDRIMSLVEELDKPIGYMSRRVLEHETPPPVPVSVPPAPKPYPAPAKRRAAEELDDSDTVSFLDRPQRPRSGER